MKKVLFICHGNICRSPIAEYIMKSLTNDLYIESAATSNEEIGNHIYPPARQELKKHNIKGFENKTARQVNKSDYDKFDYLVIMDEENRRGLMRIIDNDQNNKVIKLLDRDIDDPWYTRDFDKCYNDIYQGCKILLDSIRNI